MRSLWFYRSLSRLCQVLSFAILRYRNRGKSSYHGARHNDIPSHVQQLFDAIISTFGSELTIDIFLLFVERQRGKPLHIVYCDMGTGTTGYVLAFPDCDIIFLRSDLTPERERLVLFHECAHLLLKHIEYVSKDCADLSYDVVLRSPAIVLTSWFHSNDYARPGEYDAEAFATLMNRVLPATASMEIPEVTKAVLGYHRGNTAP